MSNVEYQAADTLQVQLTRPDSGTPWGFRLQGGTDFSTPLSVQVVQPNSVAEQCGLHAGDGILQINSVNTDTLTHENAKMQIVRSGNEILMLVARGAVRVWKPQITPLSELRPAELAPIKSASGEEFIPVQKTSLVHNKPVQEPCRIGSSHNRSARPFGASSMSSTQKTATPNVVLAQYNTPISLYSADNIAHSYATQTAGIRKEMQGLDIQDQDVGQKMSAATYQPVPQENEGGFRSVKAPTPVPASERKPQQPSMRCGGCDMLAQGVIVKAKGVPYHVQCFKCASCSMNLKQKGYFVVDDKLYCETHARRMAQPPEADMVAVPVYR